MHQKYKVTVILRAAGNYSLENLVSVGHTPGLNFFLIIDSNNSKLKLK